MKNAPLLSSPAESEYIAPQASVLSFEVELVLCESPLPGGNEGIGYENWN